MTLQVHNVDYSPELVTELFKLAETSNSDLFILTKDKAGKIFTAQCFFDGYENTVQVSGSKQIKNNSVMKMELHERLMENGRRKITIVDFVANRVLTESAEMIEFIGKTFDPIGSLNNNWKVSYPAKGTHLVKYVSE